MNIDARIHLNLSQRLVMTPMLQQAIKLLQMSRLELVDLVKQEMMENPVLEELDEGLEAPLPSQEGGEQSPPLEASGEISADLSRQEEEPANQQESLINWEEYFNDNPSTLGYYGEYEPDEGTPTYDAFLSQPLSLSEHLLWQLQMSQLPERTMNIGRFLIGQIDDDGYLQCQEDGQPEASKKTTASLPSKALREFRAFVLTNLCQKINAEFERDYLHAQLNPPDHDNILAHVLLQDFYEDVVNARYAEITYRLRHFTLKNLETIAQLLCKLPLETLNQITGIPRQDIQAGLERIKTICGDLEHIVEQHCRILLEGDYAAKLEELELAPEEFYLVEYLLLKLSAEELTYIADQGKTTKTAKIAEKDIEAYLARLQQSYAHIDQLQSHRYFLIQLYTVGVGLLVQHFPVNQSPWLQTLLLRLLQVTEKDVTQAATSLSRHLTTFYETEQKVSQKEVEVILQHIQTFTPPGVGARDLKECLLIQAGNIGNHSNAVETVISDYFEEIQRQDYHKIAADLKLSLEDVRAVHKIIIGMSPRPGADYSVERPEYIIPDIYVYKVDGEYEVVLNEDDLPNLRINPMYKKFITGNSSDVSSSAKQYVDQKLRSAVWFIRSVEQRKRTVYKVGKSIVLFQHEFLEHGVSHLKPLVLRDVADDISMHESTVSRVTTNKYIHTPQGVFELKFFFHSGLESTSGIDVSSIAIKEKIRQMIEGEKPEQPLSDKTIEKMMKVAGVAIARRTIAKYREELHIPSSIQRKRKKMMDGQWTKA